MRLVACERQGSFSALSMFACKAGPVSGAKTLIDAIEDGVCGQVVDGIGL